MLFVSGLGLLLISACDVSSSPHPSTSGEQRSPEQAADEVSGGNPFLIPLPRSQQPGSGESCVESSLQIELRGTRPPIEGSVRFRNDCDYGVAVLTSPLEVRRYLRREDILHWEGMRSPFATLVVFRLDLGPPKLTGDWGKTVWGGPDYCVVPAHSTSSLPLEGLSTLDLPAGAYGVYFTTWLTPTRLAEGPAKGIDLSLSVDRFDDEHPGQPEVARAWNFVWTVSNLSKFKVE